MTKCVWLIAVCVGSALAQEVPQVKVCDILRQPYLYKDFRIRVRALIVFDQSGQAMLTDAQSVHENRDRPCTLYVDLLDGIDPSPFTPTRPFVANGFAQRYKPRIPEYGVIVTVEGRIPSPRGPYVDPKESQLRPTPPDPRRIALFVETVIDRTP